MVKKTKAASKKKQAKEEKDVLPEVDKEYYELQIQDLHKKLTSHTMGPKKNKALEKRGQEAGDKEKLDEVEKEFFELQLKDINKKITRLLARNTELEEELEEVKRTLQKLDEDRADIIAFLKKTLQAKTDEIVELQERLAAVQQARETEKEAFIEKIKCMEDDFKVMHEQLTADIKLLCGKLNSLEEFRAQREDLMNKYLMQEKGMEEKEERHKQLLYEVERKFIIAKDELKKDMESKLLQLSLDFQNATQMRIAPTTQRVIRENVAVNNELAALTESWKQLNEDVSELQLNKDVQQKELLNHKEETLTALKINEIQSQVTYRVSNEYDLILSKFNKIKHFEKLMDEREKELIAAQKLLSDKETELFKGQQLIHYYLNEKHEKKQMFEEEDRERKHLGAIISRARTIIKRHLLFGESENQSLLKKHKESIQRDSTPELKIRELRRTDSVLSRDTMLNTLHDLFTANLMERVSIRKSIITSMISPVIEEKID